jgi:hypothetical protein
MLNIPCIEALSEKVWIFYARSTKQLYAAEMSVPGTLALQDANIQILKRKHSEL